MLKILGRILGVIFLPLKKISGWLFKFLLLPFYQLLYLSKKWAKKNFGREKISFWGSLAAHRFWPPAVLIIIFILTLIYNFHTKVVAAEEMGKKSLLYYLSAGDEFEEIIEEKQLAVASPKESADAPLAVDYLPPTETSLNKFELNLEKMPAPTIESQPAEEGLAAETLFKTGSPETVTSPQPREKIQTYTIASGDTLSSIAKKFGLSLSTLLWANNLSSYSIIRPGNQLTILPVNGVAYKIKKGDTVSKIAKTYGVAADKIFSYNQMVSDEQLSVGQPLVIPDGRPLAAPTAPSSQTLASLQWRSSERKEAGFIWPTTARRITQYYKWNHLALDIGGQTGLPIYAAMSGKIIQAGWGRGYGYYVTIDHGNGQKTLYGHLSKILVSRGEEVTQGTVIGAMGSTGWSTGPHLHFEIVISGKKVNPLSYL